jgi:hypothetical protein
MAALKVGELESIPLLFDSRNVTPLFGLTVTAESGKLGSP